ncbi:MAG TPA: sigma 54-interacting transcriptional regulator [Thermoanaerobaculia bacterium]|nr:sigma 54-interacting transcriptional regulator [Thermoanaerobaculia bacterium]
MQVSLNDFSWSRFAVATLRHCSLPWADGVTAEWEIPAIALGAPNDLGARDRLSLVAQFAAHQAFLQFAGIGEGAFDPQEWVVVRKRGQDCRLVRVAAAGGDSGLLLSLGTVMEEFARAIAAPALDVFRQPWWRAEAVYAEVAQRLRSDVAADLRWMRKAAAGEVVAPGASALRQIWTQRSGRHVYRESAVAESLAAMAAIDDAVRVVFIGTRFPARRYSALETLDTSLVSSTAGEAAVAQRVSTLLESQRAIVVVRPDEQLDPASRSVVDITARLGTATWLIHAPDDSLGSSRYFALSARMGGQSQLETRLKAESEPRKWLESFVASDAYDRYLDSAKVPPAASNFSGVPEPKRSLIAAVALLGSCIPREVAARFVKECLIDQPLEQLLVDGVCGMDGEAFFFQSDDIRAECAAHIPSASRPALFRAAAALCEPERAALLLFEAGDRDRAFELLERVVWSDPEEIVAKLLPLRSVPPPLAGTLATALIECGRYREAAEVDHAGEGIQARVDRRRGEYTTALSRLERKTGRDFTAQRLLCELLRLAHRFDDAAAAASALRPHTVEEELGKSYEQALIALERGDPPDTLWLVPGEYHSLRFETYRALRTDDFDSAAAFAGDAVLAARSTIERIDAWLDRVFTSFSAGRWSETRTLALEALTVIDDAPGDRAAAAILYTLAYLAADDAQWRVAEHLISRLRQHYGGSDRDERLAEANLLEAHLDFCRGRFAEAHRCASAVLEVPKLAPQIREAAALIVDEIEWIRGREVPPRSSGDCGNRELERRRSILLNRRAGARVDLEHTSPASRSEELQLFRAAVAAGRQDLATSIAADLDLTMERLPEASKTDELTVLSIAATSRFPYQSDVFGDRRWCFASRNRLGHWSATGSLQIGNEELDAIALSGGTDWLSISDRELLFFEGAGTWSDVSQRALRATFALHAEAARLRRLVDAGEGETNPRKAGSHDIVGESAAIREVFHLIDRVAGRDVAVCILGESGTGKELVARAIQRASARRTKPFMPVNCAALPETLIESELFGHVRGAFTGADRDRAGLIETTDGGTLFLDEIGELPLIAQAKLLRFLQDGEFRRVGEAVSRSADVRIISATNCKLEGAVENGSFREDLYYRLRGVEIELPALRERGNDLLLLAHHFLAEERSRHRSGPAALSSEVESVFRAYRWPGNVRELQNTIRAAHAMAGDGREVELEHLPARVRNCVVVRASAGSYQDAVTRFRRDLIEKSLLEAAGNQNRAAALLNISRQALAYQIRELGIMVKKASLPRL